jgi:hypothetical protein
MPFVKKLDGCSTPCSLSTRPIMTLPPQHNNFVQKALNLAIQPSSNGRFLSTYRHREPFFWLADTAWELFHWYVAVEERPAYTRGV